VCYIATNFAAVKHFVLVLYMKFVLMNFYLFFLESVASRGSYSSVLAGLQHAQTTQQGQGRHLTLPAQVPLAAD
jgi:hypothetical protein